MEINFLSGQEDHNINGHETALSSTFISGKPSQINTQHKTTTEKGERALVWDVPGQGIVATHSMRNDQQKKTQCWMSEAN